MIKDLRELRSLMTLCRKAGVREIKVGDVSLTFGDPPPPRRRGRARVSDEPLMPDMPSDDQMAFYSAGGLGEDH